MWNFYDELCTGIPSGIRVEECVVGKHWVTVKAGGNVGVARMMGDTDQDPAALGRSVVGKYLRDLANHMKWKCLTCASIGVAAMNAFYNRADKLESLRDGDLSCDVSGKKVAVIGELPNVEIALMGCAAMEVLPLPDNKELCENYRSAMNSDVVLISGDTLINQTLPALLDMAGGDTKVKLFGASVPAAAVLFAFDNPVHALSGVYLKADQVCEVDGLNVSGDGFYMIPVQPEFLHESAEVSRYEASPYRATKFNNAFNPWEGKQYDQSNWSPLFKG